MRIKSPSLGSDLPEKATALSFPLLLSFALVVNGDCSDDLCKVQGQLLRPCTMALQVGDALSPEYGFW